MPDDGSTYSRVVRFLPDAGGDDSGDDDGGGGGQGAALLLDSPWKVSAGLKPDTNHATCSYAEYQNLGGQLGVSGTVQFCFSDPDEPDLSLAKVRLLDAEPLEYGVLAGQGGGAVATKYRLVFVDDRFGFVEPRGGRLNHGLLNPSNQVPQDPNRQNAPQVQKLSDLINLCLTAMGQQDVEVPDGVDDVDPPQDLKWFGTHAPTELAKLLSMADCVWVLQPDGTYEIHQRGDGQDPQIPDGRALPAVSLDGADGRGKTVVFTSFPTQIAMVLRVTGDSDTDDVDPGIFRVVGRNADGAWVPIDECPAYNNSSAATAIAALNKHFPATPNPADQESCYKYLQLDPDIYDPLVSPLLRKTWADPDDSSGGGDGGSGDDGEGEDGGDEKLPPQIDLSVKATLAIQAPATQTWVNSPAPVNVPVVGTFDGGVVKLGLRLVKLPDGVSATSDPDAVCVPVSIEDLQFRIAVGVAEYDAQHTLWKPGYWYCGFSGSDGDLTTLSSDDAEAAMSDPDTIVVTLPDLVAVQYGEQADQPFNQDQLVDRCNGLAARFLQDASKPPRVLAAVGFMDFTFDGTMTEVQIDQRAVLTRFRMDSWFRPAGSYLASEFERLRRKQESHPHEAQQQGLRQAMGATGSSAPAQPMDHFMPAPTVAGPDAGQAPAGRGQRRQRPLDVRLVDLHGDEQPVRGHLRHEVPRAGPAADRHGGGRRRPRSAWRT